MTNYLLWIAGDTVLNLSKYSYYLDNTSVETIEKNFDTKYLVYQDLK